ncbi:hypothetical protein IV203_013391 [Nitzschia inconspicua]|uniref:Pectin lyase-like protein n=1 Tax=Nitzschia inconspicua TaxID=303405 RepID=A0A9K3M8P4_9STRA|nr:hypothetical protein IV203_013391 [Nitzschia inconspicua]
MTGTKLKHHQLLWNDISSLFLLWLINLPSQVVAQSCFDNFYDIYQRESIVTDTTFPRLYTVCPRTIYEIATLDFNGNIKEPVESGVQPPLPLRANMTIRCGDLGARDSLCWLAGGDIHMDGTAVRGINDETVEGVSIEGFVFIGARRHSLWATKPGDITFKDCEWREFVSSQVPIMLDYYDANSPSSKLVATFEDCEFKDNRYFGMGSMNSLIYGNSAQNTIIVKQSLFQYNDMIINNTRPDTHSFIIESLGPTSVENSCFQDNLVGASDIVVFGSSFESSTNHASNSSGSLCSFSSVFQNIQQFDAFTPDCVEATSDACARYVTGPPSIAPSEGPTAVASDAPSFSPTNGPTITPYPTGLASDSPSLSPSTLGDVVASSESPVEFTFPDTSVPAAGSTLSSIGKATSIFCMSIILCYLCI